MRKKVLIVLAAVLVLILGYLIETGFRKQTNVGLVDYAVSEDGTQITLHTAVMSSAGYTRGFTDSVGTSHFLTFYATFGGINSRFGANDTFLLTLNPEDTAIYFNRSGGENELILQKNPETGVWERV